MEAGAVLSKNTLQWPLGTTSRLSWSQPVSGERRREEVSSISLVGCRSSVIYPLCSGCGQDSGRMLAFSLVYFRMMVTRENFLNKQKGGNLTQTFQSKHFLPRYLQVEPLRKGRGQF